MSYQVLARKWRPKQFTEMVGQEHVLKALVNALDDDRLHHAYLFTGTRGVGKTSIARLFAKALNCEQGISSKPCDQCSACAEIAQGRFVDLIEVDAASRTKVEDTRELLENVQYAPSRGRFKVYLIDEVHMLSKSSFNALLKTLEEPPPHVKFLLATTDPQKLPVTVLSRCLQFNLKNMIPKRIVEHLANVLSAEQITFEETALWLLARSADGSMRDALSLTDQSIAFGAGRITEIDVRVMLGTIDLRLVYQIIEALVNNDGVGLLKSVDDLAQFSPDYNTVLGDIVSLLHRIAIAQTVPAALDNSLGDQEQVLALAAGLSAEDVQLFYQIALMGRKDLPFVPDAREGVEMTLMRMLAFRPARSEHITPIAPLSGLADAGSEKKSDSSFNTQTASAPDSVVHSDDFKIDTPEVVLPLESQEVAEARVKKKRANDAVNSPNEQRNPAQHRSISLAENPAVSNHQGEEILEVTLHHQIVGQTSTAVMPVGLKVLEGGVDPETIEVPHKQASSCQEDQASSDDFQANVETNVGQKVKPPLAASEASSALNPAVDLPQTEKTAVVNLLLEERDVPPWEDDYQSYQRQNELDPAASDSKNEPGLAVNKESDIAIEPLNRKGSSQIDISKMLPPAVTNYAQFSLDDWAALVGSLGFTGMTAHIAENLSLESIKGKKIAFNVSQLQKNVLDVTQKQRIHAKLVEYFKTDLVVGFDSEQSTRETPWQCFEKLRAKRLRQAMVSFQTDATVIQLVSAFSAEIDRSSIMPIG